MSAVSNVRGVLQVEVPKDVEAVMTTFATAKPGTEEAKSASVTLTKLFQAIKNSNLPAYPTGTELSAEKALLIKLREYNERTQGFVEKAHKEVRANTKGIFALIVGTPESHALYSRKNTFASWTSQLDGKLAKVVTLEETLEKQSEAVRSRQFRPMLPQRDALSNVELKAQMPLPALVSINGNKRDTLYGMFETLFEALGMPHDKVKLDSRANTFGKDNIFVPDLKGADITVLKNVDVRRFDDMAAALEARCSEFKVRATGLSFFVPTETEAARTISITAKADKTATIRLESTFSLARVKGEDAIATVTATYTVEVAADGKTKTTCIFYNVQPTVGLVKLTDLQKLLEIFKKARIDAPAAVSTDIA